MDYFFYLLFAFLYLYLYLRYRYYKAYPSKNILITGGTDGIGKAWVEKYAKNSCINKIYVVGRNIERLTELQTFILNKYNKNIHCIVCDLDNNINLDIFNVAKLDVDTIVYSAGVSYPMALLSENVDIELTNNIINVNCISTTIIINYLLQNNNNNIKNILLIGSGNGIISTGIPFYSVYAASKSYIDQYAKSISVEYPYINIQVHHPFLVCSKMSKINKPSLFVPSADTFVNYSYNEFLKFNNNNISKVPYIYHYLQYIIIKMLPYNFVKSYLYATNYKLYKKANLKTRSI